jgi:hypothetical protein
MNIRNIFVSLMVVLILFSVATSSVLGSAVIDDDKTRESLKGLGGVYVVVDFGKYTFKELEKFSLYEEQIKSDVELKLRLAGINVIPEGDIANITGTPMLNIFIFGKIYDPEVNKRLDISVIFIGVELTQRTYLQRNPNIKVLATTWSTSVISFGQTGTMSNRVRNVVKDKIDTFINAYLSVNPKEKK